MAEKPVELGRIDWSECFAFTHIFKTFRMSLQWEKLLLALAGIVLMSLWGVILGLFVPEKSRPVGDEIVAFGQVPNIDAWRAEANEPARLQRIRSAYTAMAKLGIAIPADLEKDLAEDPAKVIGEAFEELQHGYEKAIRDAEGDRSQIAAIARQYALAHEMIQSGQSNGVSASFMSYQRGVLRQGLMAARGLNVMGSMEAVLTGRHQGPKTLDQIQPIRSGPDGIGVLPCVGLAFRGVQWLIYEHFLFAVFFLAGTLVIWSLLGGAICRLSAVNIATGERQSLTTSLKFARQKLFGFLSAPLLPVMLVIVIGAFLFLGGLLVLSIPYAGEIVGGLGMGLALLGGFAISLVMLGAIGGGSLMWPTIAVEGSDCFDAMSRSYSYVYSRPWRTALYAGVATLYGAVVYLFARFFVLVMLVMTRLFVGLGVRVWPTHRPGTGMEAAKKLDALWPFPSFENLRPTPLPFAMENWDAAGAVLIELWLFIVVALLGAMLISFYLTGSTIIYYLLRRRVDATDMEDVYLESDEGEDDEHAAAYPASESPSPPESPSVAEEGSAGEAPATDDTEENSAG